MGNEIKVTLLLVTSEYSNVMLLKLPKTQMKYPVVGKRIVFGFKIS